MQQFTVPQFIDVENKIIGPISTRQFLIIVAGGIMIFACYKLFDFALFITLAIIIAILTLLFGFYKVNGRPLQYFFLSLIQTFKKPMLRVWNHKAMITEIGDIKNITYKEFIPKKEAYESSRLAALSLVVDTKGKFEITDDIEDIQIDHN
ncbi:PrgI family protein [bacterium]|nr:PrgI family protein [bacterium]